MPFKFNALVSVPELPDVSGPNLCYFHISLLLLYQIENMLNAQNEEGSDLSCVAEMPKFVD